MVSPVIRLRAINAAQKRHRHPTQARTKQTARKTSTVKNLKHAVLATAANPGKKGLKKPAVVKEEPNSQPTGPVAKKSLLKNGPAVVGKKKQVIKFTPAERARVKRRAKSGVVALR